MSDELLRGFAPITPSAWQMIDQEASRVLQVHLTARRLIQTRGPLGWDHSAVNSGRATRALRRQRFMLRGDIRALMSARGILRFDVSRMRFGQISDSVKTATSGRQ